MSGTNRDDNLSPTEVEQFAKLEATVKRGLETRLELVDALADIRDARLHRDTHETFEAYLRERWRLDPQPELTSLSSEDSAALAQVWQQALTEFGGDVTAADIRLTIHGRQPPDGQRRAPAPIVRVRSEELLTELCWLLTQATGTVSNAAHHLETRAAEVGEAAREQLREEVLVLDEELATLKAMLAAAVDWDAEYGRLLEDEIPPYEEEGDDEVQG